jgi:phosphotransferase system  glucose/maltose/N-acetylglucosamine-specific IIC component
MTPAVLGVLLPIILGLGAFMMIWGIRYFENKENMAMIERGLEPKKARHQADPSRTLRNALMFIGAGTGLLLAIVVSNTFDLREESAAGVFFALIAIFGGSGMLAAYLYERKNPPTSPEK